MIIYHQALAPSNPSVSAACQFNTILFGYIRVLLIRVQSQVRDRVYRVDNYGY